jgi:hypothetical protein
MLIGEIFGDIDSFSELLAVACNNAATAWEQNFCVDICNRFAKYGDETHLTNTQAEKIRELQKPYSERKPNRN